VNGPPTPVQILGAPQVTVIDGDVGATTYVPFSGSITGTGTITVWNPPEGYLFRLQGGYVTGVVKTALNASEAVLLYFADSADSNRVVVPIAGLAANEAAGSKIHATPFAFNLPRGRIASAETSTLIIDIDQDIDSGEVKLCGVVWGLEVAD